MLFGLERANMDIAGGRHRGARTFDDAGFAVLGPDGERSTDRVPLCCFWGRRGVLRRLSRG
jgi:hypothetical protein